MRMTVLAVVLCGLSCACHAQEWLVGETKVTSADLFAAPVWRAQDKEPPLSVGDAIVAAGKHIRTNAPSASPYRMVSVTLKPLNEQLGHWIYAVEYGEDRKTSPLRRTTVVVLMNGKVVEIKY